MVAPIFPRPAAFFKNDPLAVPVIPPLSAQTFVIRRAIILHR